MDDFYLRKTAGLYPDVLEPVENDLVVATDSSHALYVTCEIPEDAKAGSNLYSMVPLQHWGFNFYFSADSKKVINPFLDTDADEHFPAGDSFSVYPGVDGPLESLRSEAFYQGLQDNRACRLLESLIRRNETLKVIQEDAEITLTAYPRSSEKITALRDRINCKIREVIG